LHVEPDETERGRDEIYVDGSSSTMRTRVRSSGTGAPPGDGLSVLCSVIDAILDHCIEPAVLSRAHESMLGTS